MTAPASSRNVALGSLIAIAGGAVTAIGALLPWSVNVNGIGTTLGFDYGDGYDGKIFLFLAVLTIVASGVRLLENRLPPGAVGTVGRLLGSGAGIALLCGAYIASFAFIHLRDISAAVESINSAAPGLASVGLGIYLDLAAGLAMMVGGGIGLISSGRQ